MIRIFNPYSANFLKTVIVFSAIFTLAYCKTNSKTQANSFQERYSEIRVKLENIYTNRTNRGVFAGLFNTQTEFTTTTSNGKLELRQVLDLLAKNGWPSIKNVGEKANTAVWLVLLDANAEEQEKYLPLLKASVAKGESNPAHLAFIEDKILVSKGKPQLYGTQILIAEGETNLYPVSNPIELNKRRKTLGLEPIEVYLASISQL